MAKILINDAIPIFTNYFHALSLTGTKNVFTSNAGSADIVPRPNYRSFDLVDQLINPLKSKGILKTDGNDLLLPMEGLLAVPSVPAATGKYPLLIIGHGNHTGYFLTSDHKPDTINPQGFFDITILDPPRPSYRGYEDFQDHLATRGIASYSINLNIVNSPFDNQEPLPFNRQALDFNQRILLFFLNLKLLKILAGETITIPPTGDEFPIKFFNGTSLLNINDALNSLTPSSTSQLSLLRNALSNKIDFTRLGFMGHSRGADAVSRVSAYFFKGNTLNDPSFPFNPEVNSRIKKLAVQIGSPQQDTIKSILALEPTAAKNDDDPDKHGYIIDNSQTVYFVGVGTHDEDVSFDAVRIYEYPQCSKVMIAINGATHKRFNSVWAQDEGTDEFGDKTVQVHLIPKDQHRDILKTVFGTCFTTTLGSNLRDLLYFTKEIRFPINLPAGIDIQAAWKFGFPLQLSASTLDSLDTKVTGLSSESLKSSSFQFEQDISAFYKEKDNTETFPVKIPVTPGTQEDLSRFTHFSFRFAKGYSLSSHPDHIEKKNFTMQFFKNDNLVGKMLTGDDFVNIELKALQAFDQSSANTGKNFEYSILLQTVEVSLLDHFSGADLATINRIEIDIIPDDTKSPPLPTSTVVLGSIGGGLLGSAVGFGGVFLFDKYVENLGDKKRKSEIIAALIGAAAGTYTGYRLLRAERNAFVFKDFLLTNRTIPISTP